MDKLDAELGSIVANELIDVRGRPDVAFRVGIVGPALTVRRAVGVLVSDGVPKLVASCLDRVPAKPPVILISGN